MKNAASSTLKRVAGMLYVIGTGHPRLGRLVRFRFYVHGATSGNPHGTFALASMDSLSTSVVLPDDGMT
jgi:hypothetical protein